MSNNFYFRDRFKEFLQSIGIINKRNVRELSPIDEGKTFQENLLENKIWFRGLNRELEQFYMANKYLDFTSFWGSANIKERIRKIHIPMAQLTVNILKDITVNSIEDIDISRAQYKKLWENIYEENNLSDLLDNALEGVLVYGDGAFKLNWDSSFSSLPIIEWVNASDIEYKYKYGRIQEIIFKKVYFKDDKRFVLLEFYGKGYIKYKLTDSEGSIYPLNTIEELIGLEDKYFTKENGQLDTNIFLAIPFKIWDSNLYQGRGKSIFEGKKQIYDELDETISQWVDALRKGRIQKYIPESLIPRTRDGKLVIDDDRFNEFIKVADYSTSEDASAKIEVIEPEIQVDKYKESYLTFFELSIDGLISASTIGINTKRLDNAEAQREKEKVTLYTRKSIIKGIRESLEKLIRESIYLYNYENSEKNSKDYTVLINFGEYANPSFEARVEVMAKAKQAGIMSNEFIVDELYPEMKLEERKMEVERLYKNDESKKVGTNTFNEEEKAASTEYELDY